MPPASASLGGRLAYLDWLRFLVVLSLAPFHAAITFTGMGSVYVYDNPVRDILLAGATPVGVGPLVLTDVYRLHGQLVHAPAFSRVGDRRRHSRSGKETLVSSWENAVTGCFSRSLSARCS